MVEVTTCNVDINDSFVNINEHSKFSGSFLLATPYALVMIFLTWNNQTFYLCLLQLGKWHVADEYDGQVREITFRSLCHSPMCPPDTAMTELQHIVLSPDKRTLVCLIHSISCSFFFFFNNSFKWFTPVFSFFSCKYANSFYNFSSFFG